MWLELITAVFGILALGAGLFVGRFLEAKHYRSIKKRETDFFNQPAVTGEFYDDDFEISQSEIVVGSVVVSIDRFKRFLAGWKLLFGGEIRSYSPLLDRGRREAVLRMKESAPHAHIFVNCRLETSTIASGRGQALGTVEVLAYATAITYGPRKNGETLEVCSEAP